VDKLGFSRIFEALLALMIIITPLLIPRHFRATRCVGELRGILFDALVEADENGELTRLIYSGEWRALYESIERLLPSEINFAVEVLDGNGRVISSFSRGAIGDNDVAVAVYVLTFRGDVRIVLVKGSW